jgi:hypothetical protein
MPADPAGVPGPEHRPRPTPDPGGQLVNSPVPGSPMISAEAAARALCELFLANADRGDNAANDHLIAEMVERIRTQQEQLEVTAPPCQLNYHESPTIGGATSTVPPFPRHAGSNRLQ